MASTGAAVTPPASGLVGWWQGEGNGNDSAGGHNGTVESGVSFTTGVVGQAFDFHPGFVNNSRVYIPDDVAFQLTSSLSISAWINAQGNGFAILHRGDNRPGLDPYSLGLDGAGHLSFVIEASSTSYTSLTTANTLPLNQWMLVTGTLDGSSGDMRVYVNDTLVAQTFTTVRPFGSLDPTRDPAIGIGNVGEHVNNFPFIGYIDEVLLYSRALSPTEVAALVPEPSVAALIGLGAVALGIFRRRSKVATRTAVA